jgi:endonuclease III related protein
MLKKIYSKLTEVFNPQGWWPITPENSLKPVYHYNKPLSEKQKLEICFGAILTQNTNWKNVEKAIINLNKNSLININKIIKIKNGKLANIIRSSGYHNQKAKKLKNFSRFLNKKYNNDLKKLFDKNITELRKELLSVNGMLQRSRYLLLTPTQGE